MRRGHGEVNYQVDLRVQQQVRHTLGAQLVRSSKLLRACVIQVGAGNNAHVCWKVGAAGNVSRCNVAAANQSDVHG